MLFRPDFKICSFALLCWYLGACSRTDQAAQEPLFVPISAEHSGIHFSNLLFENEDLNIITFEYFYNGAGVGIIDINNDGLQDIFFAANMLESKLYLNKGDFVFEDITQKAGFRTKGKWATGVAVVDINQDGWLDIYLCFAGPYADPQQRANQLYINQGNSTFKEQAQEYGLADTGHSTQAAFLDYDLDGDLDMYLLTNMTDETGPNIIRPKRLQGQMPNTDRLYRNNGKDKTGQVTFSNVSKEAGITAEGYGLGVSIGDVNQDGWPDIYVSNDYLSNDLLYISNQDGTFTNRARQLLRHQSYSAMGNDIADYNNDGLLDIVTLDMLPPDNYRKKLMFGATNYNRYQAELKAGYEPQFMRNTLQLNTGLDSLGNPIFSEIGQLAGIHETDWSWASLLVDLDQDGLKDLMITNGYPKDITNRDFANYKMQEFMNAQYNRQMKRSFLQAVNSLEGAHVPNYIFKNQGNLVFKDVSSVWGFQEPSYSTGAAYADLDNDGDLDLVINNTESKAFVLKNQAEKQLKHHYLKIKLKGSPENSQGLGAKVSIYNEGQVQFHEHSLYRGFQSTVDPHIFFGLGKYALIDSLEVIWQDGKKQILQKIKADQTLTLDYASAQSSPKALKKPQKPLFEEVSPKYKINYLHRETEYPDFHTERLLPHQLSKNGPGLAVADVNGDELDDFYVGAASGQAGELFLQQADGTFLSRKITPANQPEEDLGALFLDADQDGDADLYLVSGSNELPENSPYYQDRLFLNDGKGNFRYAAEALPKMLSSGSCVTAADYDRDGDLDLFVGGRIKPQHYPEPAQSYLLRNEGGKFIDATSTVCPELKKIGMVTAALWTDFDGDFQVDLMVVGEWMPLSFFKNVNGTLKNISAHTGLKNSEGWWNSLHGADFDRDGDTDYLVGNLGLNSPHKASEKEPVCLYVYDFNGDQRMDPVLCHYVQGKNYPVHPLDDMVGQINTFKKTFGTYESYARSSLTEVFPSETLQKADLLKAYNLQSIYLENLGQAKFQIKTLPLEAQFAPIYGIQIEDYNLDGHQDALLTGNSYAPDVLTGRYDAFSGLLLQGDGKGSFRPAKSTESGFYVDEDGKSLATLIRNSGKILILATRNNQTLKVYEQTTNSAGWLRLRPEDVWVEIHQTDGKIIRKEFYYGEGYLSQSSRSLLIPQGTGKILIRNFQGKQREIKNWRTLAGLQ